MYVCHEANSWGCATVPSSSSFTRPTTAAWPRKKQGLVNVSFWVYWTSPYSSHYRPYTYWLGDVQWTIESRWFFFATVEVSQCYPHRKLLGESRTTYWFLMIFGRVPKKHCSKKTVGWCMLLQVGFALWNVGSPCFFLMVLHGSQAPSTCTCSWSWPWGVNFTPRAQGAGEVIKS